MLAYFQKHLKEVDESYLQHMCVALGIALKCQCAAIAQLIHAVFPFVSPPCGLDVKEFSSFLMSKCGEERRVLKD